MFDGVCFVVGERCDLRWGKMGGDESRKRREPNKSRNWLIWLRRKVPDSI